MSTMNGSKAGAREVIAGILNDERFKSSSHFSDRIYSDEPILTTGRQMASYLPDRYREMKKITQYEVGDGSGRGRWIPEAELFYRQGMFMADFEDDCPYRGVFKAFFPTYNAMSDRQLRGYFTWRTAVRHGDIQETSTPFAFMYLYELICGIGVGSPREGFDRIAGFWNAYRQFVPDIDRYAGVWLQDYVVYHGLDPQLLAPYKTMSFDHALITLRAVAGQADQRLQAIKREGGASALPLPANEQLEERLIEALDALSTYRLRETELYAERPEMLRHVSCSVFIRMAGYYEHQRKKGILENWFGEKVRLPYTMFGSAVFFDPHKHPDTVYELDEVHRYICQDGLWTCERVHGSRQSSPKIGSMLRSVWQAACQELGSGHAADAKQKTPKYVQKFIEQELEAWKTWEAARKAREVVIDLSQLSSIRHAAAQTREALLIEEERSGTGELVSAADGIIHGLAEEEPVSPPRPDAPADTPAPAATDRNERSADVPWKAYLRALLDGDGAARGAAVASSGQSEDMLMDQANEALFETVGDTVIEYGDTGPKLIEDYRDDVRGFLHHD